MLDFPTCVLPSTNTLYSNGAVSTLKWFIVGKILLQVASDVNSQNVLQREPDTK